MVGEQVEVEQGETAQSGVETSKVKETRAEKAPEPAKPEGKDKSEKGLARPSGIESLKPGMRIKGKVRNVVDFGAFIDIGVGRDGLAHISTLKRAGIEKTIKVGDALDVIVRRVSVEDNRISLSVPSGRKRAKTPLQDLRVDSVVSGRVVRLVDFGAFVDIGARTDGLLHVSQLPHGYVNHPSEVLEPGDKVQVRILEIDPRKRRISLTMKGLSQGGNTKEPDGQEQEDNHGLPTAFEVAFEKARTEGRRRTRR